MSLLFDNGIVQLHEGDARCLPLPDESVDVVITSPPYWSLRDYGLAPAVWGGDAECVHAWEEGDWVRRTNDNAPGPKQSTNQGSIGRDIPATSAFCTRCGAWFGDLGLEPTPELYVDHLVEIFREVRRVLKRHGSLWVNMGDSYTSGNSGQRNVGMNERLGRSPGDRRQGKGDRPRPSFRRDRAQVAPGGDFAHTAVAGLKKKDLVMMPARLAMALQADGWYLRSDVIWSKPNPMPESVDDRPTTSHEHVFMLTKSEHYYYDSYAIREKVTGNAHPRGEGVNPKSLSWNTPAGWNQAEGSHRESKVGRYAPRPRANSDFAEAVAGIPLVSQRNRRTVWEIPTAPFGMDRCRHCGLIYTADELGRLATVVVEACAVESRQIVKERSRVCRCGAHDGWGSHYATFPEALVEPCILAGSSEHGVCPKCGKPWRRVVKVTHTNPGNRSTNGDRSISNRSFTAGFEVRLETSRETVGWVQGCRHKDVEPIPATVLDPFMGSGTTAATAQRLGRHAIGLDLSRGFLELAQRRLSDITLPMVLV